MSPNRHPTVSRRWLGLLGVSALVAAAWAGCAGRPPDSSVPPPHEGVQQAWVQAVAGPGWVVRAITTAQQCPTLATPGGPVAMAERSAPGELPPPDTVQRERKPSVFTLRACEARWPMGAATVQVESVTLRAPAAEPQRIVLLGDTGCRLKASSFSYQGCNDPVDWPFSTVLASALAARPDLVIHLGDLHYRESPCGGESGCQNSPWGYGDDTWQADFFRPAQALLAAAPWVFVRGNHEECARAGQGWLRYLDAATVGTARQCDGPAPATQAGSSGNFTAPFAVPLSARTQLIVFDSAAAGGTPLSPKDLAYPIYQAQLQQVERLAAARPQNFMLHHHPLLAYGGDLLGRALPAESGLNAVFSAAHPGRLYTSAVQAVFNGHIHLFEALGFESDHPATVVVGNSGSAMFGHVKPAAGRAAAVVPGARVASFATHAEFGFSVLTRQPGAEADAWTLEAFDRHGKRLARCSLRGAQLACE